MQRVTLFLGLSITLVTLLFMLLTTVEPVFRDGQYSPFPGLIEFSYITADKPMTGIEILAQEENFIPLKDPLVNLNSNCAYLWVTLHHAETRGRDFFLVNSAWNYYTELMVVRSDELVTIAKQGDLVPLNNTEIKHNRAAFPIYMGPTQKKEWVLEFRGPRNIAIHPEIYQAPDYFRNIAQDRSLMGLFTGVFLALILINTLSGMVTRRDYFFALTLFMVSSFFFYLRYSRFLMLIFPSLSYPDWIFPLSILTNLCGAAVLGYTLLKNTWETYRNGDCWGSSVLP